MSTVVTEHDQGEFIEVDVEGVLTKEAYEAFVPLTDQRIKQHGKINLLVILRKFHGWDAGGLWQDFKFDFKHFSDIKRLALVGDSQWEKGMAVFCRPFTTAEIKYFDMSDVQAARTWIRG